MHKPTEMPPSEDPGFNKFRQTSDEIEETKPTPTVTVTKGKTRDLFQLITNPLTRGDGFRHLWLGDTGMGKTWGNDLLIKYIREKKLVNVILTLDDKNAHKAQYLGTERINAADLRKRPPGPGEMRDHIVFRGVAMTRKMSEGCDPDELARLAWEIVTQQKTKVVVNIDELADATNGNQSWQAKTLAMSYRKGRGVGICILATTQLPQILPREAFGLSDTICMFRMAGRESEYLASKKAITSESAQIVPGLEVGECLIYDKARGPMDGQVIKIGD